MGNRGRLHRDGRIYREMSSEKRWICCTMEEVFGKRELMRPDSYTELFFLDEATALAAGHRPCAQCRSDAFKKFTAAWHAAGVGADQRPTASSIDAMLDGERRDRTVRRVQSPRSLPAYAMVQLPASSNAFIVGPDRRNALLTPPRRGRSRHDWNWG